MSMNLLYENATITWKPSKNIKTVKNADIYDDGDKAYRISYIDKIENGREYGVLGLRVWKKNVISIEQ